jgi:choline kinase
MPLPSERLVDLIPAAGRGARAYPYTATIPKPMLDVDGTPLIVRNVVLLRAQLGIREIVIVVGYLPDSAEVGELLVYLGDADMVVGTRARRQMIESCGRVDASSRSR